MKANRVLGIKKNVQRNLRTNACTFKGDIFLSVGFLPSLVCWLIVFIHEIFLQMNFFMTTLLHTHLYTHTECVTDLDKQSRIGCFFSSQI